MCLHGKPINASRDCFGHHVRASTISETFYLSCSGQHGLRTLSCHACAVGPVICMEEINTMDGEPDTSSPAS